MDGAHDHLLPARLCPWSEPFCQQWSALPSGHTAPTGHELGESARTGGTEVSPCVPVRAPRVPSQSAGDSFWYALQGPRVGSPRGLVLNAPGSGSEGSSCFWFGFAWLHLNPDSKGMRQGLPPGSLGIPVRDQPHESPTKSTFLPQVFTGLCRTPSSFPGYWTPLFLTQVPDVRFVAHALRCPLKIQARVRHCQLPVAIGVPGDVCGWPLNFLGIPLGEGKRAEDWNPRLPKFRICLIFS